MAFEPCRQALSPPATADLHDGRRHQYRRGLNPVGGSGMVEVTTTRQRVRARRVNEAGLRRTTAACRAPHSTTWES